MLFVLKNDVQVFPLPVVSNGKLAHQDYHIKTYGMNKIGVFCATICLCCMWLNAVGAYLGCCALWSIMGWGGRPLSRGCFVSPFHRNFQASHSHDRPMSRSACTLPALRKHCLRNHCGLLVIFSSEDRPKDYYLLTCILMIFLFALNASHCIVVMLFPLITPFIFSWRCHDIQRIFL
jgi:hypothetical protein